MIAILICVFIATFLTFLMKKAIVFYNRKLAMSRFSEDGGSGIVKLISYASNKLGLDGADNDVLIGGGYNIGIDDSFFFEIKRTERILKITLVSACLMILPFVVKHKFSLTLTDGFFMGMLAAVLCFITASIWASSKIKEETLKIGEGVPFAVDLLAVCIQSGLSVESSMLYVAKDIKVNYPLLSRILIKCFDRSNVVGLKVALEELLSAVQIREVKSLSYTLIQSIKFGTSIYETLLSLSSDIRSLGMLRIEEKIGSLSAKMSVPLILFILMPVVILMTAPGILRLMGK